MPWPTYTVTLPTTYSKDSAFLALEPVMYKLYKDDLNVINNLHKYDLSVPTVYTRKGSSVPQGHGDSELFKCKPTGQSSSSIEGICLDGKTLKTTEDFDPPSDHEITLQLDVQIKRKDEIEKNFKIYVDIKPDCKVKEVMVNNIKSNCLPEKIKVQRGGYHEMTRNNPGGKTAKKQATKFSIKDIFHGQPVVLTKIKLNSAGSDQDLLSIDAIGVDGKVTEVITSKYRLDVHGKDIMLDIFSIVKAETIAILVEKPDGNPHSPMELEYYGFEDFCKKDAACYQEFTLWETYLKKLDPDKCPGNGGLPDLRKLYEPCISKLLYCLQRS